MAFYKSNKEVIGTQDVRESIDTSVYEESLLGLANQNQEDGYYKNAIKRYRATN